MADAPGTPSVSSSAPSTPPSSAADQARIRKERREAKIKAGGSARLDRITGLGGGVKRDAPPQPTATAAADPDEVDISQHYYEPAPRGRPSQTPAQAQQSQQINDEALRQMMLGFDPSTPPGGPGGPEANPFAGFPGLGGMGQMPGAGGAPDAEDPMMKMLQQMMGGVPGEGAGGMPSFPGMGGMAGMPGQGQAVGTADPYAYIWRLLHAIFALSLGLYIAFTTPFTGTKLARLASATSESGLTPASTNFFWIFATAELVLQSSRFFLEKGRGPQYEGIVGMVVGFLPQPWKGYVDTLGRYGRIWTTVTGDAFVCVFVLGVCAWLRGAA